MVAVQVRAYRFGIFPKEKPLSPIPPLHCTALQHCTCTWRAGEGGGKGGGERLPIQDSLASSGPSRIRDGKWNQAIVARRLRVREEEAEYSDVSSCSLQTSIQAEVEFLSGVQLDFRLDIKILGTSYVSTDMNGLSDGKLWVQLTTSPIVASTYVL